MATVTYVAGALVVAGGVMGFVRAGSKPSLIAGVAFGALYAVSAYFIQSNPASNTGYGAAIGTIC